MKTLLFLIAVACASAQPFTTYTVLAHNCNQDICNGVPLAEGGSTLNFFSQGGNFNVTTPETPVNFFMCGNPASLLCGLGVVPNKGGLRITSYNIPNPPLNGGAGATGTIDYTYIAADPFSGAVYQGTMHIVAHLVRVPTRHGSFLQLVIEGGTITVDQSTVAILD